MKIWGLEIKLQSLSLLTKCARNIMFHRNNVYLRLKKLHLIKGKVNLKKIRDCNRRKPQGKRLNQIELYRNNKFNNLNWIFKISNRFSSKFKTNLMSNCSCSNKNSQMVTMLITNWVAVIEVEAGKCHSTMTTLDSNLIMERKTMRTLQWEVTNKINNSCSKLNKLVPQTNNNQVNFRVKNYYRLIRHKHNKCSRLSLLCFCHLVSLNQIIRCKALSRLSSNKFNRTKTSFSTSKIIYIQM